MSIIDTQFARQSTVLENQGYSIVGKPDDPDYTIISSESIVTQRVTRLN